MRKCQKPPVEILCENSPYSSEFDFETETTGFEFWKQLTFEQVIAEVQEIADKYSIGSGWVHGEEMADGSQGAKQELKELKALIRHMKRVYKKEVA